MGAPPSEEKIYWSPDNPLDVDDVSIVCHEEYFSVAITRRVSKARCLSFDIKLIHNSYEALLRLSFELFRFSSSCLG